MIDNYRNLDFEVYVRLHDMQGILSHYEIEDEFYQEIMNCMELIRTKRYRVAVIGEFSRGKSSLLNALLGSRILPTDITPTTATINRITFDLEPRVQLRYRDGRADAVIDISELEEYVTKLTEEQEETAESIAEAVIYYPTVICQNNIDLIDTPGLNEDEKMTRLTVEQLQKIDAAIVLVSALSPLDQVEQNLIVTLIESREVDCLIFAVSFIDCLDEDERPRVLETIGKRIQSVSGEIEAKYGAEHELTRKAHRILNQMELYGVSASQALKAFEKNNNRLLKESRFPEFQKALYRILTAQQSSNALIKTLRMMMNSGEQLEEWYGQKKKRLEDALSLDIQNREALVRYYDTVEQRIGEICDRHVKQLEEYLPGTEDGELPFASFFASPAAFPGGELRCRLLQICIGDLGDIQMDGAREILEAIERMDGKVSSCARNCIARAQEQLKEDTMEGLYEFEALRRTELYGHLVRYAQETAGQIEQRCGQEQEDLRARKEYQAEAYHFFNEEYTLADPELQQRTGFCLADPRHCNYVVYMAKMIERYVRIVQSGVEQYQGELEAFYDALKEEALSGREALLQKVDAVIHDRRDDLVVHDKTYEKHRAELQELKEYAGETIRNIQEGTVK